VAAAAATEMMHQNQYSNSLFN